MYLTTDGLKKMAAQSVAQLKHEGIPLNESIMKIAMENEMNSDQVKRMVETTNQLAYISELSESADRTFEFDVANYDSVLDGMLPAQGMDKAASHKISPMDIINGHFSPIEKVAQEKEATIEKWGRNEKIQALKKLASHDRNRLEELLCNEHDNLVKLAQDRAIVSRDPEALLKMSQFDNGKHMAKVVYGHEKVAESHKLWSPADMQQVKALSDRLIMCKEAQAQKVELQERLGRADEFLKQAFIGAAANMARSMASRGAASAKASPKMTKLKKAYGTFDAIDSSNEVRKGSKKNYDAWSSLRGKY